MYIGIAIEFIIPIGYSLISRYIFSRKRFGGLWIFAGAISMTVGVFSIWYPNIFYQSSGGLSSSGTETVYVAISIIIMTIISHIMANLIMPQIIKVVVVAIAGTITISYGSWIS